MGSHWTVTPESRRVDLEFDGKPFWIEIKKELTTGEVKRIESSGFLRGRQVKDAQEADAVEMNIDWDALVFTKTKTWLSGWSLTDDGGKALPLNLDTLRALRPSMFAIIEKTVDAHAAEVAADEKKFRGSEPELKKISA